MSATISLDPSSSEDQARRAERNKRVLEAAARQYRIQEAILKAIPPKSSEIDVEAALVDLLASYILRRSRRSSAQKGRKQS